MSRNYNRSFNLVPAATVLQAAFPVVSNEQFSQGYTGVEVTIDSTARTGGTSITPSIEEWDPAAQAWEATAMLTGAAITTADTHYVLRIGPNVTAVTNLALQRALPARWRVRVIETGTITSAAFSIGVNYFDS